jgi:hypothetical protein
MLRTSGVAGERVGAGVVRVNRKLEWVCNSKRSTSISTFQFVSIMVYCDITVRIWFMFSPTDRLHQTGHRPSSLSLMGRHALEAEPSRLA